MAKNKYKIALIVVIVVFLAVLSTLSYSFINYYNATQNKLSEIERLDTDSDKDGLTLREELKKETDPEIEDTDLDGLLDGFDTNPNGGGRFLPVRYDVTWQDETFTTGFNIHSDWYDFYKNIEREDIEEVRNFDEYFTPYDPTIQSMAEELVSYEEGLDLAIRLVQYLDYEFDVETGFGEYPKYPVETLVDGTSDCEDSSFLLASLLEAMGHDAVLVVFPEHVGVGLACDDCEGTYYGIGSRRYYYIETTEPGWDIGMIAEEDYDESPAIVEVSF